jgi:Ser-tRNA(Ala) deacylase AlaX
MTELVCKKNSTTRAVKARVLECVAVGGKFEVVPDQTVLYPAGGGQPSDCGTIDGITVQALQVRSDGAVVHVLGAPVSGEVIIAVDWPRRFDYMQQHTAQHIMTALAARHMGWKTIAFHMNPDRSDVEFELDQIAPADLVRLEEMVNDVVISNVPVQISFVSRAEFETMDVRSRLLPEGIDGPIRLVGIDGVDLNTCGGTHVASTGAVQQVKILGIEKLTRGIRVHYAAGTRVRRVLAEMLDRELAISQILTTGPSDFVASVESLKTSSRDLQMQTRALQQRLALMVVERLGEAPGGDLRCVVAHHDDDPDSDFLRMVAERFHAVFPERAALITGGVTDGLFMVVGPDSFVAAAGPAAASIMEGRGGGRGGIFQGRAKSLSLWTEALAEMQRLFTCQDTHQQP